MTRHDHKIHRLISVFTVLALLQVLSPSAGAAELTAGGLILPDFSSTAVWAVAGADQTSNGTVFAGGLPSSFLEEKSESPDDGRIWGGSFLAVGVGATLYGFLERGTFYSSKDVTRTIIEDDGTVRELTFTLYDKSHANPHTALLTTIGLFCNGSYFMLKDQMDGVDLEEYSSVFSERNMAWYSIAMGSLVTAGAFMIPEYTDKTRRGYEKVTEPGGRVQYFPVQDENRSYSYRQFAANVGSGLIYIGFGVWKLLTTDRSPESHVHPRKSSSHSWAISVVPTMEPAGAVVTCRF